MFTDVLPVAIRSGQKVKRQPGNTDVGLPSRPHSVSRQLCTACHCRITLLSQTVAFPLFVLSWVINYLLFGLRLLFIQVIFQCVIANGHTTLKAPVLVRSPKLSNVGPG